MGVVVIINGEEVGPGNAKVKVWRVNGYCGGGAGFGGADGGAGKYGVITAGGGLLGFVVEIEGGLAVVLVKRAVGVAAANVTGLEVHGGYDSFDYCAARLFWRGAARLGY